MYKDGYQEHGQEQLNEDAFAGRDGRFKQSQAVVHCAAMVMVVRGGGVIGLV